MLFAYCPQCGHMDFKVVAAGKECLKCRYVGKMSEGAMDEINAVRKRAKSVAPPVQSMSSNPAAENGASVKELAERLKSMKGKSDSDVEFL